MWRSEARHARAGFLRAALAAACLAALAGCATPRLPDAEAGAAPRSSWLGRFSASWTVDGPPPSMEQAGGRFTLVDGDGRTELEIFSPLGQTLARAVAGPDGATLETADGRRFEAGNAEALTERALGWRIPVRRLPAWLAERNTDHAVDTGWSVSIDDREDGLPRRLVLAWPHETVPTTWRRVTIRLVIDERRIAGAAAP